MVLETRSPSLHNMLRRKPPPPASQPKQSTIKIERPAKRLKREADGFAEYEASGNGSRAISPSSIRRGIVADSDADSQDGDLDEELPCTQRTDLEQALPPVSTDREAIQQYEAMRAAEAASSPDEASQGARYKSSIYVDAFFLALDTVLEEESHLFNEAEMKVFQQWRKLSYQSQYLFVPSLPIHFEQPRSFN